MTSVPASFTCRIGFGNHRLYWRGDKGTVKNAEFRTGEGDDFDVRRLSDGTYAIGFGNKFKLFWRGDEGTTKNAEFRATAPKGKFDTFAIEGTPEGSGKVDKCKIGFSNGTYNLYWSGDEGDVKNAEFREGAGDEFQIEVLEAPWDFQPPSAPPATGPIDVRMFKSPWTEEHLYSTDPKEAAALTAGGWVDAGTPFQVLPEKAPGTVPLYRLRFPDRSLHMWSVGAEKEHLEKNGWDVEWPIGGVFTSEQKKPPTVGVRRLHNPNTAQHFWTASSQVWEKMENSGWDLEGYAFYALPPKKS